jgi:hypothetical protein
MVVAKNATAGKGTRSTKKKATPQATAAGKMAGTRNTKGPVRVPKSAKEASQSRFPGETPLTGEDRPANRPGGKNQRQQESRKPQKGRAAK